MPWSGYGARRRTDETARAGEVRQNALGTSDLRRADAQSDGRLPDDGNPATVHRVERKYAKQERKNLEIAFNLKPGVRAIDRPSVEKPQDGTSRRSFDRYLRLVTVVDLPIHFQDMLDRGEVRNHGVRSPFCCISRERTSQNMMLAWLAPNIHQQVINLPKTRGGGFPLTDTALLSIVRIPVGEDQREQWEKLVPTSASTK